MEEYMSEKLIAEIPLTIIVKESKLSGHIMNYANKNLR
jgi:hypothetical protein